MRSKAASLLVLAPLRIEQLALGTPPNARLLRTGMGRSRARIAAARALADPASAVAVVGLCAAIAPELSAGDIVCASELRSEDGDRVLLPDNSLLVSSLRGLGLRVFAGPLLSSERILGPAERNEHQGDGLLGVDMESLWLAAAATERPFAVVRVVADAAGRRLADPRMLLAGSRALRNLRRLAPALTAWGDAVSPSDDSFLEIGASGDGTGSATDIVKLVVPERRTSLQMRNKIVDTQHVVAALESRRSYTPVRNA
jgi:4-hydroxy-3-methylbut-2-en-1-yl diphosphate reductase